MSNRKCSTSALETISENSQGTKAVTLLYSLRTMNTSEAK